MWYSIGIKAGMLLVTLGVVLWLGWSVPVDPQADPISRTVPLYIPRDHQPPSFHKVNLNQATLEDLRELPGIGPVLAQRILVQREQAGPFRTLEDLLVVKGVGTKRLEGLRPFLRFGDQKKVLPRISIFQEAKKRSTLVS